MALIVDKVLHSLDTSIPTLTADCGRSIVDIIFDFVRKELEEKGDRIYCKEVENETPSDNPFKERNLSDVIPISSRIANALLSKGMRTGDVALLAMNHNVDFYLTVLGVWAAGGTAAMADPTLTPDKFKLLLNNTKPKLVFCSSSTEEMAVEGGCNDIIVITSGKSSSKVTTFQEFIRDQPVTTPTGHKELTGSDLAVIFCSSGSTGAPKGIKWSFASVILTLTNPIYKGDSGDETYLTICGMFHGYGFLTHLANAFCNSVTFIFFTFGVSVERFLAACAEYKPNTLMTGVHFGLKLSKYRPAAAGMLTEEATHHWDSVKLVVPIGAKLCENVVDKIRDKFPNARVMNAYGMTEVGCVGVSYTYANLGSLVRGAKVAIAEVTEKREEEKVVLLGPNTVGEILIKTECQMVGYLNGDSSVFTSDGFVRSGDLGYYDELGQLFYKDRLKAVFKCRGGIFYPMELECMIQKMPGVADVGVFGVKDEDLQEVITAVVVKEPGAKLTDDSILQEVNRQVGWSKQISGGVHFVEEIKRNCVGKVMAGHLIKLREESARERQ